jgi:hypothetical protein
MNICDSLPPFTLFGLVLAASCGGSQPAAERVASVSAPLTLSPRNACLNVTGFNQPGVTIVSKTTTPIQSGVPTTQPTSGAVCVETGHSMGGVLGLDSPTDFIVRGNTIVVDVDNPRLYTQPALGKPTTVRFGTVNQDASRQAKTFTYQFSDFTTDGSLGDGAPSGFLVGGSAAESISIFPQIDGAFGPSESSSAFPGETAGVRVGYSNLRSQVGTVDPSTVRSDDLGITLHLNPNVLLIPIQAIAIVGPTITPKLSDLNSQLALWDRVPTCTVQKKTAAPNGPAVTSQQAGVAGCVGLAPTPELETSIRQLTSEIDDGADGFGTFGSLFVPDDIWAQCGIQFRLVSQFAMFMDGTTAVPAQPGDFYAQLPLKDLQGVGSSGPVTDMKNQAMHDGRYIRNMPAVLLPSSCSFVSDPHLDFGDKGPPSVACAGTIASMSDPNTWSLALAHELGHTVGGLGDTYSSAAGSCLEGDDPLDLMCGAGTHLSASQCQTARTNAQQLIDVLKAQNQYFRIPVDTTNFNIIPYYANGRQPLRIVQALASGSRVTTAAINVGASGAFYTRSFQNASWPAPTALSAAGFAPPTAGVAAGAQSPTQNDAFVVGNDGKVYVTSQTNSGPWQPLSPLTAANFAPPGALLTTAGVAGQLGVFLVDNAGKLQVITWTSARGWLAPVAVTAAGYAQPGSVLGVGTRSTGEFDVFSIGTDGALKYMFYNLGIWGGPLFLTPGNFAPPGASVAVALDVHGFLNVLTIGNDGALYTKWDATPLWAGPTALTAKGFAPATGGVSAINFNGKSLNVFLVDKTGALDMLSNAGLAWSGPTSIAPYAAAPGAATIAVVQGTNEIDLFVVSAAAASGVLETTNTGAAWTPLVALP